MTTEYNNEVYMNPVPTGFGSYTGVSIFNRSAKSVTYVAEMSETVLYKLPKKNKSDGLSKKSAGTL